MCNLYRMTKTTDEIAHLFDAVVGQVGNAAPGLAGQVSWLPAARCDQ